MLKELNQEVTVLSLPDKSGNLFIQMGMIKTKVKQEKLAVFNKQLAKKTNLPNYQKESFTLKKSFASYKEMRNNSKNHDLSDIYEKIWKGSYPELNINNDLDWETFYKSYLQTYIERDIKDLNAVKNEMDFLKFLKVLAARTGQMLNYADISNEVGVSVPTIKRKYKGDKK